MHITIPNFTKTGQMAAELIAFNGIHNGSQLPSSIVKVEFLNS